MGVMKLLVKVGMADDDGTEAKEVPNEAKDKAGVTSTPSPTHVAVTPITYTSPIAETHSNADDSNAFGIIMTAVTEAGKGGYGIMQFKAEIDVLESIIPDEPTRYKAVYSPKKATGAISLEQLDASIDQAIKIIEAEESDFNGFIQASYDADVQSKLTQVEQISAEKAKCGEQITKLTEKITELTNQELALRNEASIENAKIEGKKNTYISAKNRAVTMVTTIKNKIHTYLA
jgi:hypothetical protein